MAKAGKKILLVDDDASLRQSLAEQLQLHEEFDTVAADNGAQALETVKSQHFDLILLDVGLPDMDGRDVCRLLRRSNVRVPVIMLTAADSDADAILGLDSGANDYVAKPFKLGVLLARIRAQTPAIRTERRRGFRDRSLFLPAPAPRCWWFRRPTRKSASPRRRPRSLKYLLRAGSVVVARDVLLNQVWGYNSGVTHAHAGNPCLPAAPENRAGSIERRNPGHRNGRLPSDPVKRTFLAAQAPESTRSASRRRLTRMV